MEPTSDRVPAQLAEIGARTERRVLDVVASEAARWEEAAPPLVEPLRVLGDLVRAGGKRLRPAFCHWGFVAAGGDPGDPRALDAAAAIELLHTMALVHDDVMDGSDLRRGTATVHEWFIECHRAKGWASEARRFGEGAAIVVGDIAFVLADVLLAEAPRAARQVFDEMRLELCVGQYLDLVGTAAAEPDGDAAARIALFKSGKYTVERPLQLGTALAGRLDELAAPLEAVGLPLGRAFQLRDDVLGVWGDAELLGKPVGQDLREGKPTPLLAHAWAHASDAQRRELRRLGRRDLSEKEIDGLTRLLEELGARAMAEAAIEQWVAEALDALDAAPISEEARVGLKELASFVAWRDR